MHEIIPIFTSNFNGSQTQSIDARKLHEFLEVKSKFSDWIQNRIKKYEFIESVDYIKVSKILETSQGYQIDYIISIDMAKELSMVENNIKGREARQYFITKERQANNLMQIQQPKIDSQFLLQLSQEMAKKEQLIEEQAKEIQILENTTQKQAEENQKLKITIKDFFKGAELFTRRQVCHFLARQGLNVKEQEITDFLNKKRWLCKGDYNTNKATAKSCRIGWFVNDISLYEVGGRKKTSEYGKFTVDGLIGVYEIFKK